MSISPSLIAQVAPIVNVQNLGGGGQAPVIGLNPASGTTSASQLGQPGPSPATAGAAQLVQGLGNGQLPPSIGQQPPDAARALPNSGPAGLQQAQQPVAPIRTGNNGPGNAEVGGKGKGKRKGGGKIPPGLAKKDPNSLPDGNPWKQVLIQNARQQQALATGPNPGSNSTLAAGGLPPGGLRA